jgi:hypothetical protein
MSKKSEFLFTKENLIENISKVGVWSAYGLAQEALRYYFPDEYEEDGECLGGVQRELELLEKLGCNSWQEVIIKYHREVGYKPKGGRFNPLAVNLF